MRVTLPEPESPMAVPAKEAVRAVGRPSTYVSGAATDPLSRFLAPWTEHAYALMRVIVGIAYLFHGLQKLFGVLSDSRPPVGSQAWFGGVIELFAGAAIALGLFTAWAAFLASGEMAVAYIQKHWKLAFDEGFFPIVNKGELALVFCFLFLFIACRGGGRWSLDAALRRTRS
jgi:putative oxidoreductase